MEKTRDMKPMAVFFGALALTAFALSFSNDILNNYFNEVYHTSALQRGLIEAPRESPGVLMIFVMAALAFASDIRKAMFAQILSIAGILYLGFHTPSFNVMLIFLFINSMGMHMFMPLQDSIGMSLAKEGNIGRRMGQYRGVYTAFMLLGYIFIYFSFKSGFLSFDTKIKWVFIICGSTLSVVLLLLFLLEKLLKHPPKSKANDRGWLNLKLVKKEYKYYYLLVIMFGMQKQLMSVYGPWVIITIMGKSTDTIAVLAMAGAAVGIFFIPTVGHMMDRFGIRKLLFADAISFIVVYAVYGFMSGRLNNGTFHLYGWPVIFMYGLFIFDKMSGQLGIVRSVYLKSILMEPKDLTPTLSLGLSMDHIVSISFAILCGFIWNNYGPQYIFYLVSLLSFVNLYVAFKVKPALDECELSENNG